MIVETRHDASVEPSDRLSHRFFWRVSAAILTWSVLFGFAMSSYNSYARR